MIARVEVLGIRVSAVNREMAMAEIERYITENHREYVCVTGVHGVMASQDDSELREIHNSSGLTTPDGMPLVWCARAAGAGWVDRVYGPDMLLSLTARSSETGWRNFFYGSAPGVPESLVRNLKTRSPGLQIAGTHSPPFRPLTDEEVRSTADRINDSKADIVWVGLSTPKQERWMARFRPLLEAPVLIGVGAAFDIHAGNVPQAPRWMQRSGLEWAFRLVNEPRRLWKRYLYNNPRFAARILIQRPKLHPPDSAN